MEWYIPITILPGIGMFIISTSNLIIALNDEIRELNVEKMKFRIIIIKKISQLKKLNFSLIGQYISALSLVLGGVLGGITENPKTIIVLVFIGVVFLAISIALLIQYSIVSVRIRQQHLKL